jgi:hypothetical protein
MEDIEDKILEILNTFKRQFWNVVMMMLVVILCFITCVTIVTVKKG